MLAAALIIPVLVGSALLLAFGVTLDELIRYGLFEFAFSLAPGVLVYGALTGWRGSRLTLIAVGWPVGYALELAFFNLTAALDVRDLFWLYPPIVFLILGVPAYRALAGAEWRPIAIPRAAVLISSISLTAGMIYLALGMFSPVELARDTAGTAYFQDVTYHLSIAAEALQHWPIEDPSVAGEPLRYHTFVHMHAAAGSQVTGVELEVVLNRLLIPIQLGLLALQVFVLGRMLGSRAIAGAAAVALLLVAGELDLDPDRVAPFLGQFFRSFMLSPSFALGLTFLAAIAILLWQRLETSEAGRGHVVALALLAAGAAGAKAAVLPVVFGGLAAVFVYKRLLGDDRRSNAALDSVLLGTTFVVMYLVMYSGGGGGGLNFDPLTILVGTVGEQLIGFSDASVGELGLWALFTPVSMLALLAPLLPAAFVIARRGRDLGPGRVFLVGGFVAGMTATFALGHPAGGQLYFGFYGYLLLVPLAAEGMVQAVEDVKRNRASSSWIAGAGLGAAVLLSVVAWAISSRPAVTYLVAYGGLALVATFVVGRILSHRGPERTGRLSVALAVLAMFAVGASTVDAPLDWLADPVDRVIGGESVYSRPPLGSVHGIDDELYDGLRWVRQNSTPSDLLAVNNHWADNANTVPVFFYYSAFAERRVFLESWLYSSPTYELGFHRVRSGLAIPYPERTALNSRAFEGHTQALDELRARGVDLLLVDRLNGLDVELPGPADQVFQNQAIRVYRFADERSPTAR